VRHIVNIALNLGVLKWELLMLYYELKLYFAPILIDESSLGRDGKILI
jgi:hypothetical protein